MPGLPSLIPRKAEKPEDHVGSAVSAFESETQAVIQRTTPYSEHAILHALGVLFVIAFVFMAVVKLDRVVTSAGKITNTQGSLFVQPLEKSIVREISVSTGEIVRKGQVLATLDPTFAAADLAQLQQKGTSAKALVARLEAERADMPYAAVADDHYSQLQESLYQQRRAEHAQSLADFDARINGAESANASAVREAEDYAERLKLAQAKEGMAVTLEAKGYGSKLKTIEARDARVEIQRMRASSESQIQETQHNLEALQAQREVYVRKWQDDLTTALVTAHNDLDEATQQLSKASRVHELIRLEAPEDAVVLQIGSASVGSVVDSQNQQQPLFTLTPLRGPLEAEVQIDAKDIGFIAPGDPVAVKLDAYSFIRHGTAKGVIKTISEGSFTQDQSGATRTPFFKARITVDPDGLRNVPRSFRLIPGMTIAADVLIGHRTILSYLVEGGLRTGAEAMREP